MPRTTIAKEFTFDAAHALGSGYDGLCRFIHGHTYRVRIELTAPDLDRFGMVADFGSLKPVKQWIDAYLDHCLILNGTDDKHTALYDAMVDLGDGFRRVHLLDSNPTAENIAALILDEARRILGGVVFAVTVWETPTAYARVTIDLQEDNNVS